MTVKPEYDYTAPTGFLLTVVPCNILVLLVVKPELDYNAPSLVTTGNSTSLNTIILHLLVVLTYLLVLVIESGYY